MNLVFQVGEKSMDEKYKMFWQYKMLQAMQRYTNNWQHQIFSQELSMAGKDENKKSLNSKPEGSK